MTISLSRGISSDIFLRLCTRAPCTAIVLRAAGLALLELIRCFSEIDKRQFLDADIALLRDSDRLSDLTNQSLICKIFARGRATSDVEVPLEPGLDLAA